MKFVGTAKPLAFCLRGQTPHAPHLVGNYLTVRYGDLTEFCPGGPVEAASWGPNIETWRPHAAGGTYWYSPGDAHTPDRLLYRPPVAAETTEVGPAAR